MSPSPSSEAPYEIFDYTLERLISVISGKTGATAEYLNRKSHISYFRNYFSHRDISAKSIIVESEYVDHDYMEDYVAYYAKCFTEYDRHCSRVHFFSDTIVEERFVNALKGQEEGYNAYLQDNYLGFIVVKPLPRTTIGRTCLKTYDSDGGRRNYLSINTNRVNLFGFELTVKSLPFQEQDSIVSACATSALWSAFNATGKIFQHHIPSPSEITKAATQSSPGESRYFPNIEGLTAAQMADAVRHVGLEPLRIKAKDPDIFRRTLYAYLKSGIPALLMILLVDTSKAKGKEYLGAHAVAVTGYSLGLPAPIATSPGDIKLVASRVDKIYVHDDGVGPFSRLVIDPAPTDWGEGRLDFSLTTTWRCSDGTEGKVKALPQMLLIPTYNKVRIHFHTVFEIIRQLDALVRLLDENQFKVFNGDLCWDIYLSTVNNYKISMLENGLLQGEELSRILTGCFPKFLWVASAMHGTTKLCDFIFDATGIEQGSNLTSIIIFDDIIVPVLKVLKSIEEHLEYGARRDLQCVFSMLP